MELTLNVPTMWAAGGVGAVPAVLCACVGATLLHDAPPSVVDADILTYENVLGVLVAQAVWGYHLADPNDEGYLADAASNLRGLAEAVIHRCVRGAGNEAKPRGLCFVAGPQDEGTAIDMLPFIVGRMPSWAQWLNEGHLRLMVYPRDPLAWWLAQVAVGNVATTTFSGMVVAANGYTAVAGGTWRKCRMMLEWGAREPAQTGTARVRLAGKVKSWLGHPAFGLTHMGAALGAALAEACDYRLTPRVVVAPAGVDIPPVSPPVPVNRHSVPVPAIELAIQASSRTFRRGRA